MKSTRVLVAAALLTVGLLGLGGCGRLANTVNSATADTSAVGDFTAMSTEAQALEAIGFSADEVAPAAAVASDAVAGDPVASAADPGPTEEAQETDGTGRHPLRKYKRLRFAFGKRTLHAEAVVQTNDGTATVVVQRGTVTAIDATSMTVKSADGFVLTWTFGDQLRVFERRSSVPASAVRVGLSVGVAGAKKSDAAVARLIVIPNG